MPYAVEDLQRATRKAHRDAIESSPEYMAGSLQNALGKKLVAYIVGVGDSKTVGRWATGERNPTADNEARLRLAFQIYWLLTPVESAYTIRAWFAGLNPLLGDESPATAIRDGRLQQAMAAARAFVSDG
jgi:hypothetical protein